MRRKVCAGIQILLGAFLSLGVGPFLGFHGFGRLGAQEPPVILDTLEVMVGSRVSAELPILTRSVQLLGQEEIAALPVRTISGLLEWATGVEVLSRSPAQSDLSLRGAGFEQVVVLVNGVRVSDPQTGHFDLDLTVPLDQVERLEILRGPASALYGADAMGGVVNVVTRVDPSHSQARLEGGTWGTGRFSGSAGYQNQAGLSLRAGGELARSDGHRSGTDYEMALFHLGASHPLGAGSFRGEVGFSRRDFGAQDFYAPYPSFEKTRSYTSSLRWTSGVAGWGSLQVGTSFRRHEDEFTLIREDPQVYQNRHTSSQGGVDLLLKAAPRSSLDVAGGAEFYGDFLRSNSLGDRTEGRGAFFGEAVWGRGGPGVLTAGLRQDWHEGYGSFTSPSLSGSVRLGIGLRLRGAVGRSFRAPTFTERYYSDPVNQGREDLDPERAWSGEVGADVTLRDGVRLGITLFERRAEALIDWARPLAAEEDTPWETRNVEKATFQGLEGDVSVEGPLGSFWSLGFMALSVDSEEAGGYRSKYALRPLAEKYVVSAQRTFLDRLSLALHLQRHRRTGEGSHHRLDLRTSLKVGGANLYLDGVNLTDESYPDITGARAPGRALHLGLELGG